MGNSPFQKSPRGFARGDGQAWNSLIHDEHLTFVSLILSLIFREKIRAICLKFFLIFSQGENKKEVIYLWEKD